MARKFREMQIWRRAMRFVVDVYALTATFPKHELFGLTSQLRRAATSIVLNIAEGAGCDSDAEFRRFLEIALRSTYEVMTALEIASGLEYCTRHQINDLLQESDEIAAMIYGFMKTLKADR